MILIDCELPKKEEEIEYLYHVDSSKSGMKSSSKARTLVLRWSKVLDGSRQQSLDMRN
jgi:hypothetical protein